MSPRRFSRTGIVVWRRQGDRIEVLGAFGSTEQAHRHLARSEG
jgi:hypothetical protein